LMTNLALMAGFNTI